MSERTAFANKKTTLIKPENPDFGFTWHYLMATHMMFTLIGCGDDRG
ncbi:hypothetical protein FOWG_14210 [Fusarium oxysporum f. sp. lycopersici MN25]|nr:hypothetical protein FOWG_14210 [Fusarium oxysporum f. sp. lycopersici MN25]